MYVADAVAMPVHWMYNLRNLKRDYGEITGYVAPKEAVRKLKNILPDRNSLILDVGCGTGLFGRLLKNEGYETI